MIKTRRMALLAAMALLPVTAGAQDNDFARLMAEANKVPDTPGDGPYPAVMELDPGIPDHVVYRPADLTPFEGGKLGVFA